MSARHLRRLLLCGIALLYLLSVPWYRAAGEVPELWFGLPDWVAVALACYAASAVLNAAAWWITDVDDTADEEVR